MSIRVARTLSGVNAVFAADQRRIQAIFVEDLGPRFGQRFDLTQIGIEPADDGRLLWRGRHGSWRRGEHRLIFDSVHGNEVELGVRVEGETEDAEDLLREVWAELGRLSGEERDLQDVPFYRDYHTRSVVQADRAYWEELPAVGRVETLLRERMGTRLATSPPHLKLELPVNVAIGGIIRTRNLAIETRFTAEDGHHFYFASPLPSADHRALVEAFFESATA